jgi:uncharacterized membrane protein
MREQARETSAAIEGTCHQNNVKNDSELQTKAHPFIWRQDLQPPFRSKQEVIINAPLEAVWSFSMDLTKIPEFHLRVVKADLLSGKTLR